MAIVLQKTFSEQTREEVMQHLEAVRGRRMVASIAYHNARQLDLAVEAEKIRYKVEASYEQLGKELVRLEQLEDKILKRVNALSAMTTEYNLLTETP